jgi:hypothetical protein
MIVIAIGPEAFVRRRSRVFEWLEELSGKRVVLVTSPSKGAPSSAAPVRLLIPVLDEFYPEVLALAGALTSSSRVPDVDIVAAKVIEMPATVPLYSTYRPESLVDSTKELSFLRMVSGLPLLGRLSARVVLVRNISRDLALFTEERRIDMIILRGDWVAIKRGFLSKKERELVARAPCRVAVLVPPRSTSRANE